MSTSRKRRFFLLITVALLAMFFGVWVHYNRQPSHEVKPVLQTATGFETPRPIIPVSLIDAEGKPFLLDRLKGHWSLLFFGFTRCPDLCPTTLSVLNQADGIWATDHLADPPQVVFISVDPESDTPEKVKAYVQSFNPRFIGLTGSKKNIDDLTNQLSVLYTKVQQGQSSAEYSIDHSGTLIILDPEGRFYGVFTLPHDAKRIAQDMSTLVQSRRPS